MKKLITAAAVVLALTGGAAVTNRIGSLTSNSQVTTAEGFAYATNLTVQTGASLGARVTVVEQALPTTTNAFVGLVRDAAGRADVVSNAMVVAVRAEKNRAQGVETGLDARVGAVEAIAATNQAGIASMDARLGARIDESFAYTASVSNRLEAAKGVNLKLDAVSNMVVSASNALSSAVSASYSAATGETLRVAADLLSASNALSQADSALGLRVDAERTYASEVSNKLATAVQTVDGRVTALDGRVTGIGADLEGRISSESNRLNTANADVTAVSNRMESLNTARSERTEEVATYAAQVNSRLNTAKTNLEDRVAKSVAYTTAVSNKLQVAINSLSTFDPSTIRVPVDSVNSKTGDVVVTAADIPYTGDTNDTSTVKSVFDQWRQSQTLLEAKLLTGRAATTADLNGDALWFSRLFPWRFEGTNNLAFGVSILVDDISLAPFKTRGLLGGTSLTNWLERLDSAATTGKVVEIVRDISRGGIWDPALQVWWTPKMNNGSLTYVATTNVNLEVEE